MASEIDPFSMLEVTFSVSEKEVPGLASFGDDTFYSEAKLSPPTKKMTSDNGIETIGIADDSPLHLPLNLGWRREVVLRHNSSNSKADIYYVPPHGKRCRSLKEVEKGIVGTNLTLDNFTFSRRILGVNDPDKELVRSAKDITVFKRTSLDQSLEKVCSPLKKAKMTHNHTKAKKKSGSPSEPDVTERNSMDDSGVDSPEMDATEVTDSTDVLASLNLKPTTRSPSNEVSSLTNEPTSSVADEPSSSTNEPEHDPLEAPHHVSFWCCSCFNCSSVDDKSVCCWKIPNVQVVKSDYQCITHHPGFDKLILDGDVLSITRHLLSIKTKNKKKKILLNANTPVNITWRYIAYKQFVSWINGCTAIGSRNAVVIPSCVVNAVRGRYPEQNGRYKTLTFSP